MVVSNFQNKVLKLAEQKMGFFRIVKPFIDIKSETPTRKIFVSHNICYLKYRGDQENGIAHKW